MATSWLLMGIELPMVMAALSRLPAATIQQSALNAAVYPVSMVIEAPIIMLLAATVVRCNDRRQYAQLRAFAHGAGALLTALHGALAFTPLFDHLVVPILELHREAVEPARLGLQIMLPWTWSIAWRRFQQGLLIRAGRARLVGLGTVVRLLSEGTVLLLGVAWGGLPGIAVGTLGIATGVVAEAFWAHRWAGRARRALPAGDGPAPPWRPFLLFYLPLACTPFINLVLHPLATSAMNRMPRDLESTACWGAAYGLVFLCRAPGFAFNEVVVAMWSRAGGPRALIRCGVVVGVGAVAFLALLTWTPLAPMWSTTLLALEPGTAALAVSTAGLGLLLPAYALIQNGAQAVLVVHGRTLEVTLGIALYAAVCVFLLWGAVELQVDPGSHGVIGSFTGAGLVLCCYLLWRARRAAGSSAPQAEGP